VKKLITRTLTGLVFITIVIGSICWSVYSFMLVFLVVALLGIYEFFKLALLKNIQPQFLNGLVFGGYLFVSISLYAHDVFSFGWVLLSLPVAIIISVTELFRKAGQPFTNIAYTILGGLYVALPLALLNFFFSPFELRGGFNTHVLLGVFIITWVADTAAYLVGSAIGKNKLIARISPGKTWEGSAGSAVFGVAAAYVFSLIFKDIQFLHWAIISVIIVVTGTLGDLAESMLKRSVDVKDSGTIMPGHGGILDRFDGVFFAADLVLIYIYFFIAN